MNEKKLTIILIASLSLVAIGGGLLLYWLHFSWLADLEVEIKDLTEKVEDGRAKKAALPALKADNLRLAEEIKKGEDRIPRLSTTGWQDDKGNWHFEYDDFVNLLDGLRKQSNVFVSSSKFTAMQKVTGPGALPPNVHKVTYDLSVKGTWYNLLRFIAMCESQKRVIMIEKFAYKPGTENKEKAKGPTRHDLSVRIISYTYRDGAGTIDAGGKPIEQKPAAEVTKTTLPPD